MAGVTVFCPQCAKPMRISTSKSHSTFTREAWVRCDICEIKATALVSLVNVQKAEYQPFKLLRKTVAKV